MILRDLLLFSDNILTVRTVFTALELTCFDSTDESIAKFCCAEAGRAINEKLKEKITLNKTMTFVKFFKNLFMVSPITIGILNINIIY